MTKGACPSKSPAVSIIQLHTGVDMCFLLSWAQMETPKHFKSKLLYQHVNTAPSCICKSSKFALFTVCWVEVDSPQLLFAVNEETVVFQAHRRWVWIEICNFVLVSSRNGTRCQIFWIGADIKAEHRVVSKGFPLFSLNAVWCVLHQLKSNQCVLFDSDH